MQTFSITHLLITRTLCSARYILLILLSVMSRRLCEEQQDNKPDEQQDNKPEEIEK